MIGLCALALALAAAPAEPAASAGRAEAALEAWDLPGARAAVLSLERAAPESVEAAFFRGRVLFEEGKYVEAEKSLGEAARREGGDPERSDSRIGAELRLARAAAEETKGDEVHESAHFRFFTRPGKDALLAPYALAALEKAWDGLTRDLGVQPADRIRVEVYDSAEALARVSPLTVAEIKASGTIALCKYSRLMITSPRALLRGYPWLDTLSHEFVHYLVTQKGRNAVPIWLQEGLAKFLETRWRGEPGLAVDEISLALLRAAARDGKLIPFARMHPSIAKLPTQEQAALAFAEVEAAIRLLYLRGGQPALTGLVQAMADGRSDEDAVALAFGRPFAAFEAEWRAEVKKPRTRVAASGAVRPQVARKLVFREDARGAQEPARLAQGREKGDAEGARAARLGELFYARRRWGAAAKEYGRARTQLSREEPQVARRYAFCELQLGHADSAEEALRAATTADPDDETAQALLARVLLKRGELGGARTALERGLAVDPFDPDLHDTYAQLARAQKDTALEEREKTALLLASKAPDFPRGQAP